jgi:L-alanine-DL-glutamate epimerase-like enolase superfamily enzyme
MLKCALEGLLEYLDTPEAVEKAAAWFAALRKAVGKTVDIAIDFHG